MKKDELDGKREKDKDRDYDRERDKTDRRDRDRRDTGMFSWPRFSLNGSRFYY